uniref:Ovule protein n=1 Tax=Parascaris equorum TaxID=6256 RepID=A0A914S1T0_PAREQ
MVGIERKSGAKKIEQMPLHQRRTFIISHSTKRSYTYVLTSIWYRIYTHLCTFLFVYFSSPVQSTSDALFGF